MGLEVTANHMMCIYDENEQKIITKEADKVNVGELFITMDDGSITRSKVISRIDTWKDADSTYFVVYGLPVVNKIIASPRTSTDCPDEFWN